MDFFKTTRYLYNKIRLFVLYWRRIVFVKNVFKVSPLKKIRANIFGGFLADQWVLYDLNSKKKKEYLSEFDWYRSRYINEPFDYMLNNKIVASEIFKQYIRVPEIYAVNCKKCLMDTNSNELQENSLLDILKNNSPVFIKPYAKGKGNGVNKIDYVKGQFLIDDKCIDEASLCKEIYNREDCYISEGIVQHEYAQKLFNQTINTIRIITLRDPETKQFKIFFAVQRIGTKETIPVDNASKGGLVCKIDLDSGKLSAAKSLHTVQTYTYHPDSKVKFEDVKIPMWDDLKKEILSLSNKFPYLHFIAWDVVKMEDGTNCIIEANTSSGVNIIQIWGGQRNGELGDFYEKHKVIKRKKV